MFRVIVAGGRDFDNYDLLCEKLDRILAGRDDVVIVSGKARGADSLGERYADERGYDVDSYPVTKKDWKMFPGQAGHVRNRKMARNADALVAFFDGASSGTKHMIETAEEFGLPTRIIRYQQRPQ